MNKALYTVTIFAVVLASIGCSNKVFSLTTENLKVVNRNISSVNKETSTVSLSAKEGAGLAIMKDVDFESGTIELELKGENKPGRSFIGIAFNIKNDTTYEAIYFRPFNFQSAEKIRREHSIQYISLPDNDWKNLRDNFEGQFEAEYERQPSPDEWFEVRIKIENNRVLVYDTKTQEELLSVSRLEKPASSKVALWTGNGSKGSFRKVRITK